ncbi:MAG: hypothetical protein AAGA84_02160 [Pseudomonadota bacterium]
MNELTRFEPPPKNVDGKGQRSFLQDAWTTRPRGVSAKSQRQLLADYFTSLLVWSADIHYQPQVGVPNYLYWIDGGWSLSLIGPDEWSSDPMHPRRRGIAGTCNLQADRVWTIEPSDVLLEGGEIAEEIAQRYDSFAESLDSDVPLEEALPFYAHGLRYHARVGAYSLSHSLRATMTLGGQLAIPGKQWLLALPHKPLGKSDADGNIEPKTNGD